MYQNITFEIRIESKFTYRKLTKYYKSRIFEIFTYQKLTNYYELRIFKIFTYQKLTKYYELRIFEMFRRFLIYYVLCNIALDLKTYKILTGKNLRKFSHEKIS